jgi:glycosyltransferase involved in cell wall biosynthesis
VKVLFLSPVGVLGGAERSLLDMVEALRAERPSCELSALACADGPLVSQLRGMGVKVAVREMPESLRSVGDSEDPGALAFLKTALGSRGASLPGPSLVRYLGEVREVVRQFSPDLVHSNGIKTHLLSAAMHGTGPKLVWHVRDFLSQRPVVPSLLRPLSRGVHLCLSNSRAVKEDTERALPGLDCEVVYNGIDVEAFRPGEGQGVATGAGAPFRVGLVGTFARWKGHELFLRAAAYYRARYADAPAVHFYVVGGAIYETSNSQVSLGELQQLADALGVSGAVTFLPFTESPERAMRDLDLVVNASTRPEPFGRTIVEGMACERPVLAPSSGGPLEIVDVGRTGWLFPPGSVEGLAEAIHAAARHPESLRAEMGRRARADVEARFTRKQLGKALVAAYARCLRTETGT